MDINDLSKLEETLLQLENGGIEALNPSVQKRSEQLDLNQAFIREDGGNGTNIGERLHDYSTTGTDGETFVFFRNLEKHLINFIKDADIILGCVAWLTNKKILQALSKKEGVSLVVQKEDFLRPDIIANNTWKKTLHQLYSDLPKSLDRRDFHLTVLDCLACNPDSFIDPVRCVGNYNSTKSVFPKSHHKFVIFCKMFRNCQCKICKQYKRDYIEPYFEGGQPLYPHCGYCDPTKKAEKNHIRPYAIWTGSFNFTQNAVVSFENAVILYDPKIVYAFYKEYTQLVAISESLDWSTEWIKPEWVIQTWT